MWMWKKCKANCNEEGMGNIDDETLHFGYHSLFN